MMAAAETNVLSLWGEVREGRSRPIMSVKLGSLPEMANLEILDQFRFEF